MLVLRPGSDKMLKDDLHLHSFHTLLNSSRAIKRVSRDMLASEIFLCWCDVLGCVQKLPLFFLVRSLCLESISSFDYVASQTNPGPWRLSDR